MNRVPGAGGRMLLAGLFILSLPLVNPYLRGDGNGYFAYVRSVVIDRDLDFENEFRQGDPFFRQVYFDAQGALHPWMRSATGHVVNQWAVGPAMLWLPFFLVAHLTVALANLLGAALPADGFSAPYRWCCAIGTAVYGWLAIVMTFGAAARMTGARAALLAALAIWWASSLPVYMYFLPFHVHALSGFAVALFVWYWLRVRPFGLDPRRWTVWGLTAGLMTAVYYLNAVVALIALGELRPSSRTDRSPRGLSIVTAVAGFVAGWLVAMAPHLAAKWVLHGSPLATGYQDEFFWTTPRIWEVAFSSEHGLFLWTPVVLAALFGVVLLARREARVGGALLVVFVLFYYVVASYQNWHGQSSFGNRFFVSLTSPFVLGLAVTVDRVERRLPPRRSPRLVVPAILGLLALWNVGFMFQWGVNLVPSRGPVDFRDVARNQVTTVPKRLATFGWRYIADRRGVTSEVEREDQIERQGYELKR